MIEPLDGPSKQFILSSVGTTTPVEVKAGTSPFDERKVVTLQADGKFYVFFSDTEEVPTSTDVSTKGFIQYKNSLRSYEAGQFQKIYVLAVSGTINIRGAERA